ncbi:type IV secretion protein Rhs [Capnocytophaga sp. oral taxon 878]|uniref:type IV secretion protein Rhs n=1 Tax=Capnocytophaga sp. oral taxon 878 TaxID=1316596 RepID=UPI000D0468E5|nr:type IV secretion protein Rhs [Capnocytophaga sp. oral taxon 878]AVM50885.1 type IV secretion protein Rhs [Capnocytophaga sp. oral taxon 878]
MKKIVALTLLATTISFAQNNKKNGWERANLQGKVKSIVQAGFTINESGQEIPMNTEMLTEYDKKGKTIKMSSKRQGATINFIDVYDEKGLIIESASRDDSNTLLSKNVYEYDERGNLTKHDLETPDGNSFMTRLNAYDSNDRLIERQECVAGICDDKTTYTYGSNNKVSEETRYDKDKVTKKIVYTYDANGNVTEKSVYAGDNTLQQRVLSVFDKNNNEVKVSYLDKDGKTTKTETYEYTYDKKKNWIKKKITINGTPSAILVQTIKYYN